MWMPRPAAILAVALAIGLAGCAETEFIANTTKQINNQNAPKPIGRYKVGKPYQIGGVWYYPAVDYDYVETGVASWYGPGFHNKQTANGEIFDQNELTAAHRTLPMPSFVRVTNLENGRALVLRINDRGPFAHGRIIDVSRRGAQLLGFERQGTARVRVEILPEESRRAAGMAKAGQRVTTIAATVVPGPAPRAAPRESVQASNAPVSGASNSPASATSLSAVELTRKAGQVVVHSGPAAATKLFVQVGSFENRSNAQNLERRLTAFDTVDTYPATVSGRTFHRVRIGPLASVAQADEVLERVIGLGFPAARVVVD